MTFREEIDKILEEEFFKPHNIPVTYKASNNIVYKATELIDELAAEQRKGFCIRTANKIKSKINENIEGQRVSPSPK
jgi:hypothetical protein